MTMSKELNKHMTKGGPGDKFLGGGKVDTSKWFENLPDLEEQIKNEEIWFCSAPFSLLYTNTMGELAPCSWAEEQVGPNIENTTLYDYFTRDESLNKLREEMLTPGSDLKQVDKTCYNCRHQEELYGRSRRQASMKIQSNDIRLWPRIRNSVEEFRKDGRVTLQERIFEVQVKVFGNQCNLDCYMCIPYDSSVRLQTMHSEELKDENVFSDYSKQRLKLPKVTMIDDVIRQIAELSPYIYNLKLIGGEPLVMKKFYKLLQAVIDTGHAKDIMLKYQTNMTVLEFEKHKITEYIPEFLLFEFTVSLDGIEEENNYIRRRSNWEEIKRNMEYVSLYPNVEVNINGTISFLSVLNFYKLIEWAKTNGDIIKQINWSNIRGPAKLCANVLPQKIKNKLIPLYEDFPDIQNVLIEGNHGLSHQDALDYLLMQDNKYKGTKWEMHLFEVFPELEEFYNPAAIQKRDEGFINDIQVVDLNNKVQKIQPQIGAT